MKRIILFVIFSILLTSVLFVFLISRNEMSYEHITPLAYCEDIAEISISDGLSLTIVPSTLTHEGVTLRLTNNTDTRYTYGRDSPRFLWIKDSDGNWSPVPVINNIFDWLITHILLPGRYTMIDANFVDMYGVLPAGEYKIVVEVFPYDTPREIIALSTEFVLYDVEYMN
ncbi:MAG: hypothetical protein FWF80_02145 [Defluviitaleaceae bacterium]|nr:hypothetical protein [Defluviitaleaceae bacterium]